LIFGGQCFPASYMEPSIIESPLVCKMGAQGSISQVGNYPFFIRYWTSFEWNICWFECSLHSISLLSSMRKMQVWLHWCIEIWLECKS
jgi:hypothetical protein